MILAAVGKNGTGKDFFLDYVAQKYGFPMISPSAMLSASSQLRTALS